MVNYSSGFPLGGWEGGGGREINTAEKDLSATVVAGIRTTGATDVGRVLQPNYLKRGDRGLPHFYYCSVANWYYNSTVIYTLCPGSHIIDYNCFCDSYLRSTCFLH